jgi:CheY-like chemotaxis protein
MSAGHPKVLIVDDEALLCRILAQSLARNFATITASSAVEGLEITRKQVVDVIVSDVNMPGMSGLEFLQTLRQDGVQTPFVVITSFTSKDHILQALRLGAFDFIAKPFQMSVISRLLDEANRVSQRLKRLSLVRPDAVRGGTAMTPTIHAILALASPLAVFDAGSLDQHALEIMSEKDEQRQFLACAQYVLTSARSSIDNLMNFQGRQWDLGCLLRISHGLRLASERLGFDAVVALMTALEGCYAWLRVRPEDLSTDMILSLRVVHDHFVKAFQEMQASSGVADLEPLDKALRSLEGRIVKAGGRAAS